MRKLVKFRCKFHMLANPYDNHRLIIKLEKHKQANLQPCNKAKFFHRNMAHR